MLPESRRQLSLRVGQLFIKKARLQIVHVIIRALVHITDIGRENLFFERIKLQQIELLDPFFS